MLSVEFNLLVLFKSKISKYLILQQTVALGSFNAILYRTDLSIYYPSTKELLSANSRDVSATPIFSRTFWKELKRVPTPGRIAKFAAGKKRSV